MDLEHRAIEAIQAKYPGHPLVTGEHAGQTWVFVARERLAETLAMLRDELAFDMLMDLTAVDWLDKGTPERFQVVYVLYSLAGNRYLRVKAWVPEHDPVVDTATGLWKAAAWAEREVYDMYGLEFRGHPDLRRILLPFPYTGHPLRKDYPIRGQGERFNFPKYER